jgi:hypothetical protein
MIRSSHYTYIIISLHPYTTNRYHEIKQEYQTIDTCLVHLVHTKYIVI